jgi:molybdopterin-guanine dinucleotide biosynthesis protein A
VPVVCRDDVESLVDLLHDERQRRVPPINGLVLAGGRSSRMGRDKASIEYRGRSEARRAADLLAPRCNRVVVSSRADQALPGDCGGLERINDRFVGFGPLGGILTAMSEDARAAWLVVSCDLPLLEAGDVEQLVRARNPLRVATAFASHASASCADDELLPEPLCAIYEPKARGRMLAMLARGALCPRWILRTGGTALVEPARGEAVFNANDAEEYEQALALIGETR